MAVIQKIQSYVWHGTESRPLIHLPLLTEKRFRILFSVTDSKGVSKPSDRVQGTLDLLVLKFLALEPMHGWAISHTG